jgi:hypothetical protein
MIRQAAHSRMNRAPAAGASGKRGRARRTPNLAKALEARVTALSFRTESSSIKRRCLARIEQRAPGEPHSSALCMRVQAAAPAMNVLYSTTRRIACRFELHEPKTQRVQRCVRRETLCALCQSSRRHAAFRQVERDGAVRSVQRIVSGSSGSRRRLVSNPRYR